LHFDLGTLWRAKERKCSIAKTSIILNCGKKLFYRNPRMKRKMIYNELENKMREMNEIDLSLGCRGMKNQLQHNYNVCHSKNTILKLMHKLSICNKIRRRYKRYDPKNTQHGFENIIGKNFKSDS
jgi:hypothetical protein